MSVSDESLTDLPLRTFCLLRTQKSYDEYVYLLNAPIRGIVPARTKNKIPIGSRGFLCYLNAITYNLGYVFELPKVHTTVHPTHLLIGTISYELDNIGDISTLYMDANISVLQNKKHSSYIIIPRTSETIPQPTVI